MRSSFATPTSHRSESDRQRGELRALGSAGLAVDGGREPELHLVACRLNLNVLIVCALLDGADAAVREGVQNDLRLKLLNTGKISRAIRNSTPYIPILV